MKKGKPNWEMGNARLRDIFGHWKLWLSGAKYEHGWWWWRDKCLKVLVHDLMTGASLPFNTSSAKSQQGYLSTLWSCSGKKKKEVFRFQKPGRNSYCFLWSLILSWGTELRVALLEQKERECCNIPKHYLLTLSCLTSLDFKTYLLTFKLQSVGQIWPVAYFWMACKRRMVFIF